MSGGRGRCQAHALTLQFLERLAAGGELGQ